MLYYDFVLFNMLERVFGKDISTPALLYEQVHLSHISLSCILYYFFIFLLILGANYELAGPITCSLFSLLSLQDSSPKKC